MFEVTRGITKQLDDWVNDLAAPLVPLVRMTRAGEGFFRYSQETAGGVLVAKAVRIASGLRAALLLTDNQHVTEAQSILRLVADFTAEIFAIGEGIASGRMTTSQKTFVAQFYAEFPSSPEELAERERQLYVSRGELLKAQKRLFASTVTDMSEFERLKKFIEHNYDSYVHGGYDTAMELYHGGTRRFQTRGHASAHLVCLTMGAVSGKLYESLPALAFTARLQENTVLADDIYAASNALLESKEFYTSYCSALRGKSMPLL